MIKTLIDVAIDNTAAASSKQQRRRQRLRARRALVQPGSHRPPPRPPALPPSWARNTSGKTSPAAQTAPRKHGRHVESNPSVAHGSVGRGALTIPPRGRTTMRRITSVVEPPPLRSTAGHCSGLSGCIIGRKLSGTSESATKSPLRQAQGPVMPKTYCSPTTGIPTSGQRLSTIPAGVAPMTIGVPRRFSAMVKCR